MPKCEICGKEHKHLVKCALSKDELHYMCHTCFLLAAPTSQQLSFTSYDDIRGSTYPELNMYLYDNLCDTYGIENKQALDRNPQKKKETVTTARNTDNNKNLLTNMMNNFNGDVFFGREKEISSIFDILSRRDKRNPLIIGEAGVGKTAIVKHIANLIDQKKAPSCLWNKKIYSLDLNELVAGTMYRGDLEKRFGNVIREIKGDSDTIVFIDEIHTVMKSNSGDSNTDSVGSMLKPYLSSNEIQIIGVTTFDGYRTFIEPNKAFERRFHVVRLEEQDADEVVGIIKTVAPSISSYHNIEIPDEIIESCVRLSDQYIKYRNFPDKAIDLLDMACARKKNHQKIDPNKFRSINSEISKIIDDAKPYFDNMESHIDLIDIFFGLPGSEEPIMECSLYLQQQAKELKNEIEESRRNMEYDSTLDFNDISTIVEEWTKIPVNSIAKDYKAQLKSIAPNIKKNLIGQDEAVDKVVAAVCRRRLGISKSNRPSSFIFVGETGIGKTELAKELTINLFGDVNKMIRFDMSEYMEGHSVSKLIGSPPGYVGHEESGQLTRAVKKDPFCVILFDEIEKAHPDVSNILLQILDDGRITDGKGENIDVSNAIVILTSNAGATLTKSIGFGMSAEETNNETFMKGLSQTFRPELLGRVDDIIVFNTLSNDNYKEIAKLYLERVADNLKENGVKLTYSDSVLDAICAHANVSKYHAREIGRAVTRHIENTITTFILESDNDIKALELNSDSENKITVCVPKKTTRRTKRS